MQSATSEGSSPQQPADGNACALSLWEKTHRKIVDSKREAKIEIDKMYFAWRDYDTELQQAASAEKEALETERDQLNSRLTQLSLQLEDAKQASETEREQLKGRVTELEAKLTSTENDFECSKQASESERGELKSTIFQLQAENETMEDKLKCAKEASKTESEQLEATITQLKAEITNLKHQQSVNITEFTNFLAKMKEAS